jgi:hypothetical protein
MAKELPKHIEEQRKWVQDNEKDYIEAMRLLGDVENLKAVLRGIRVKVEPLMGYNADLQPAHSAVYVVASMKERLGGLFEDLDFVEEFEDRKERYIEAVKTHALGDDETEATG